jgi:hypothetical protein
MGNFPRNCQWMKLLIANFEKIVFGNRFISLASYGESKMFVDGHLEHKCSFPKIGLPYLWVVGCQSQRQETLDLRYLCYYVTI